jgi:hypothetical protein
MLQRILPMGTTYLTLYRDAYVNSSTCTRPLTSPVIDCPPDVC